MNDTMYKDLRILTDHGTIFDSGFYSIPLYQRAFAWTRDEIEQLITDINDFDGNTYYLGSLIVSARGNGNYEVIDGQQRLTALYLLLTYLGAQPAANLTFDCRERSVKTLAGLRQNRAVDDPDEGLTEGFRAIRQQLTHMERNGDCKRETFLEKLKRVVLFRIEVPKETDLNRYFEIMNTRGEQLEQHDILKARLMSVLSDTPHEAEAFAALWDACSDMTGYVQMHFDTEKPQTGGAEREWLFGNHWEDYPAMSFAEFVQKRVQNKRPAQNTAARTLTEILCKHPAAFESDNVSDTETEKNLRFESVIDFPYFLLHVLKVYAKNKNLGTVDELLDDQKLCRRFEILPLTRDHVHGFILCLLRCRFLFDNYIIKRDYKGDDIKGAWSLYSLKSDDRKPRFLATTLKRTHEQSRTAEARHKRVVMLQACLRVSYTSPKIMHWITELLNWLYCDDFSNRSHLDEFENVIETIARNAVRKGFLDKQAFCLGVATPHIVFNYLDYLLWKTEGDNTFEFEFRGSVEHWYPQHPSVESFESWENGCDRFGNLCLLSRRINSKFSNKTPQSKKNDHAQMIARGSLKLRLMARLTVDQDGTEAHKRWRDTVCREHEAAMLALLENACTIESLC